MKAIGEIFLIWRKGIGCRRKIIGKIKKNATEGVKFSYIIKGVEEAQKEGFDTYINFSDINKEYTENVLNIFGQRLMKSERSDIQKYYDFWAIDSKYKNNVYYLLAHTQAITAIDNFEFLADFNPVKGLRFVSEISGLSHIRLSQDSLQIGDMLEWELDRNNEYDKFAVKLKKGNLNLGYVKMIHSRVFYKKTNLDFKIKVKDISKNGIINRVFIEISL